MLEKVCIIIPSLDPDEKLIFTIEGLKKAGFSRFVVVNDGSDNEHLKFFPKPDDNITLISYRKNRGKGHALKFAFNYIYENLKDIDCVVAIDGDGQHHPDDVVNCALECINSGLEKVVLGCRNFNLSNVPRRSRFGNKTTSFFFRFLCGMKISDTQTGLRAIPFPLLPTLITVKGERFEYETNMLLKFKQLDIPFTEVPIETLYFEDNKGSHFNIIRDSFSVYGFILTYVFSSMFSFVIDMLIFFFVNLYGKQFLGVSTILAATIIARAVSSVVNFNINRKRVFDAHMPLAKTIFRYYSIVIPQMLLSAGIVYFLSIVILSSAGLNTLFKLFTDMFLFFISYRFQQGWVFSDRKAFKKKLEHKKQSLTAKKIVLRSFLCLFTAIVMLFVSVFSVGLVLANGPSTAIRDMLVLSAKQASATKWLPGLFLPQSTIDEIMANSEKINTNVIDVKEITSKGDEWEDAVNGMKLEFINKPNFKAYVTLIKDPSRLKVGVSSDNFASATVGMNVFTAVEKYGALVALNGGEFSDAGGRGTGSAPIGLTYSFGKNVWNDGSKRTFIGFDKTNNLICREGMTKSEADSLGIRDVVSFQTGNVLISRSGDKLNLYYSDRNTGTAQRSAIGQRADGTVVLLVTDGRTASSIGATKNDVINILVEYGCVTAGMLDGGSSAMMYFKDYATHYGIDTSTLDTYQLQGMVNRYKAFTLPRTIPTFFIVTEE